MAGGLSGRGRGTLGCDLDCWWHVRPGTRWPGGCWAGARGMLVWGLGGQKHTGSGFQLEAQGCLGLCYIRREPDLNTRFGESNNCLVLLIGQC